MKLLRTQAEMLEAYRDRIRELGLTHQTVDAISGLPDGYTGKLMCGMKNIGPKAIPLLNGALGMAFVVAEDPEAVAKVSSRWVTRLRPLRNGPASIPASIEHEVPKIIQIAAELRDKMKRLAPMGGHARAAKLSPTKRSMIARRAIRERWRRHRERERLSSAP